VDENHEVLGVGHNDEFLLLGAQPQQLQLVLPRVNTGRRSRESHRLLYLGVDPLDQASGRTRKVPHQGGEVLRALPLVDLSRAGVERRAGQARAVGRLGRAELGDVPAGFQDRARRPIEDYRSLDARLFGKSTQRLVQRISAANLSHITISKQRAEGGRINNTEARSAMVERLNIQVSRQSGEMAVWEVPSGEVDGPRSVL